MTKASYGSSWAFVQAKLDMHKFSQFFFIYFAIVKGNKSYLAPFYYSAQLVGWLILKGNKNYVQNL